MSALANHSFAKMNGIGNEIVVLDLRGSDHVVTPAEARAIAGDPHSQFDQLMVLHAPVTPGTDAFMRIYNTDGSESAACGNGTRCVAWHLMKDGDRDSLTLETSAGVLPCTRVEALTFTVDMGAPRFGWDQIPLAEEFRDTRAIELQIGPIDAPILHSPSAVNMGNPHAIFWVDDVKAYDLPAIGPLLENHPIFPERANISLAAVKDRRHIDLWVWERGAGITRACGSAACAAAVAAARKNLTDREVVVSLPGGDLTITWRDSDGHVLMTGAVAFEWEDRFPPEIFAGAA
ncbi:MAG: diaminopimelate epimerase [Chelatococcus sp.]|uniref:diaminopimelate epimerase n=1 Tax=Chelatococcus sp. TaxID=1953771 RepID=UPI0025C46AA2|nr:diaminopimelate epimerase [Chelatococcus sp.]MBX3537005.1 diaminopimelate epimerase [Chelatococcus sp.]